MKEYKKGLFKTVSSHDEAINKDESDLEAFLTTREMEHLKFHPGKKPTIYHLRLLPHRLYASLDTISNPSLLRLEAFQLCVCKVENLKGMDGADAPIWSPTTPLPGFSGFKYISPDDMEELFGDYGAIQEIGGIAVTRHFLHLRTDPDFQAPLS